MLAMQTSKIAKKLIPTILQWLSNSFINKILLQLKISKPILRRL
jgi:hypothetical protein